MKRIIIIALSTLTFIVCRAQQKNMQTISQNGMTVTWYHQNERIYFGLSAPTDGWVAIGFNVSDDIKGTYLLMGNVIDDKPTVMEHYTVSAGNYKPLTAFAVPTQVQHIEGVESKKNTVLNFSLPVKAISKYQKDLLPGKKYVLHIAYSREDDFQHHSMMRTTVNISL
jgi:DOMON domain